MTRTQRKVSNLTSAFSAPLPVRFWLRPQAALSFYSQRERKALPNTFRLVMQFDLRGLFMLYAGWLTVELVRPRVLMSWHGRVILRGGRKPFSQANFDRAERSRTKRGELQ